MIRQESTTLCEGQETPSASSTPSSMKRAKKVKLVSFFENWQVARYLIVGVWNTLFGYACYALCVALYSRVLAARYLPLTVDLASITATPIGVTMSFLCYKQIVFRTKGNYLREWLRCLTVYGSATLPGLFALPVITRALQQFASCRTIAPYLAGAVVMGLTTIYTYFAHKNFSFSAPKSVRRSL